MPRPTRLRKIVAPPNFKGYKPYGTSRDLKEYIELFYEEYEAIKMADYDFLNHDEAAKLMGVSRPTFARIYESARRKIAQAFVESKEIRTVYGNAIFDKDWLICHSCHARFTVPSRIPEKKCPLCNSAEIFSLNKQ